ncbi:Kelch repeat-containing protein [Melittangium boletus]|uniref:Galactose oxidase n=1 Tax=Melittangium boletus DSM 14713 TaxID=1294270 RepID=A0A250IAD0_9BACT|nr:kelch repeat-containing protein [Melittangium boletus]ATB28112.1 hypothetical protein MEBOL_001557 [Melittangium boletus DSM 14713]
MRLMKPVVSLAVSLLMTACGEPAAQESPPLVTSAAALSSAVSRGCTFALSYRTNPVPFMPTEYYPTVTRQASPTCPWGAASVELNVVYSPPQMSVAANDLGVAVSYVNNYSRFRRGAGIRLQVLHLAPDTLERVSDTTFYEGYSGGVPGEVLNGELSLLTDGTTLKVRGEKVGTLQGETGSGPYYVATFPHFFTTRPPTYTLVASSTPEAQAVGSWTVTGALRSARSMHTATLLSSGEVLVLGGTTAEVFNPYDNVSTPTGSPIDSRVQNHTATVLPSGKVLALSGRLGGPSAWRSSAEVYDPATRTWTSANVMSTPRGYHTATLLDSGKVLVVGGESSQGATDSVEVYDPDTNTWSSEAPVSPPRWGHTATRLHSGRVLVLGGTSAPGTVSQDAREYDPSTHAWSSVAAMPRARSGHIAVRLYSGKVLVLGGGSDAVDIYDPYGATPWTSGPALASGNSAASATLLYSGEVLVTRSTGQASLYDPSTNTWLAAGALTAPLAAHAVTFLHTGQVLVTGGSASSDVTTVQRYTR